MPEWCIWIEIERRSIRTCLVTASTAANEVPYTFVCTCANSRNLPCDACKEALQDARRRKRMEANCKQGLRNVLGPTHVLSRISHHRGNADDDAHFFFRPKHIKKKFLRKTNPRAVTTPVLHVEPQAGRSRPVGGCTCLVLLRRWPQKVIAYGMSLFEKCLMRLRVGESHSSALLLSAG
jgi:hypothetical protein